MGTAPQDGDADPGGDRGGEVDLDDEPAGEGNGDSSRTCPAGPDAFDTLVRDLEQELAASGAVGAAVAIVCGGELEGIAGIGVTRRGGSDPILGTTRFQLASVSKMFAAAAALSVRDEGLVSFDAPVSQWVPYTNTSEPFGLPVTLHHLLTHTAGFATYWPNGDFDPYALREVFEVNDEEPLWAPPGAVWLYSNLGFALAGLALEEAVGSTYADLVETRIFGPAAMLGASLHAERVEAGGDFSYGHSFDPTLPEPIPPAGSLYAATAYGPMGGVWASAEDLVQWAFAHLGEDPSVLSAAAWADLRSPLAPTGFPGQSYGYGVFVGELREDPVLEHSGGVQGFAAEFRVAPARGFALVFLSNSDWFYPWDLFESATEEFTGMQPPDLTAYLPDRADWASLVGEYQDPVMLGSVTVAERDGHLYADFEDFGQEVELTELFRDSFSYVSPTWGLQFEAVFWGEPGEPADYLVTLDGIAARVRGD